MTVPELGRLERLDPQIAWPHEAHDFTPWLFEHGDHLAEALGIDLQLDDTEHAVGGYRLDIIGRDLSNDAVLMVENQLGVTDHGHLGQVLTYAAWIDAATIVWIARMFRDEHRKALDWLNDQSDESTHFFGIELAVGKIGEGHAPLFDVVVQPNEWRKRAGGAAENVGKGALYAEFWPRLVADVKDKHPPWTNRDPENLRRERNWIEMPSPFREAVFSFSFTRDGRLRNELYISSGDAETNDALFQRLHRQHERLEEAYGEPLEFDPLEGKQACRVAAYRDGHISETGRHGEFVRWFVASSERLRRALAAVEGGSVA